MSENKFIKRLKGEQTAKSVLEIKNESAKTSFANMPQGTSNAINVYSDHRGNATAVLEGTDVWKLNNSQFIVVPDALGDGRDFTSTYTVAGSSLWVNATYTFDQPKIFTGATQWTLKLCGHSLLSSLSNTIGFSLIIKFGNTVTITKSFSVSESAFEFCKEFIIDFSESEQTAVKVANGDTMTVQLLCADATASATIYNGMTTLVAQQRRVDGEAVASDLHTFEDLEVEVAEIQDDIVQIHEDIDNLEEYVDDTFVRLDGNSIMTGPLKIRATSSFQCAVAPFWDGVGFYKLNSDDSVTLIASIETPDGFIPWETNTYNIGSSLKKWKNLYLAGKAYMSVINNGYDIAVPVTNSADTLALKSEVDLAANSGRMITDQGVWYAKMYAATVAPSAENGTNYADFSQTDGQGNPIIVIYERQNGAWVQSETITPPAEYDGYVPITSKIWDITEQAGQQGGRILWNHQSKEFTPYPQIISFEDIEITGNSTVVMPVTPSPNQIVNKQYVDNNSNQLKYATNCITEKPADIDLVLSNGTLTLKAGSKVCVAAGQIIPNQVISQDLTFTLNTNGQYFLFRGGNIPGTTALNIGAIDSSFSGPIASRPSSTLSRRALYFATDENKMYLSGNYGSTWFTGTAITIPLAIITVSGGAISNIDKVFNDFSYIGSTIFSLPGIKGLVPNGRNSDGSLNNEISTTSTASVLDASALADGSYELLLNSNGLSYTSSINQYDEPSNKNTVTPTYHRAGEFTVFSSSLSGLIIDSVYQPLDYSILSLIYPVGSLYIGTQSSCPMASLISGSVWELVSAGNALWTGNGTSGSGSTLPANYDNAPANTTIAAGLPDHTHDLTSKLFSCEYRDIGNRCTYDFGSSTSQVDVGVTQGVSTNSIYGNSTTVQPPAYVVNVWRRTA